jgi:predicted O-methyltransferase YrrM
LGYALDDHFLLSRMQQIFLENNITTVVETGTADGDSAVRFCQCVQNYIGIEIDPVKIKQTQTLLDANNLTNYRLLFGDSSEILKDVVPTVDAAHTFFFLDAHNFSGNTAWPFFSEVRALVPGKGIIGLHDFRVPGKPFGVDDYTLNDGVVKEFNYDLIKNVLTEWSPLHRIEYMQESDPASSYRGAAFVYPN